MLCNTMQCYGLLCTAAMSRQELRGSWHTPAVLCKPMQCYAGAATVASAGCETLLKLPANSTAKPFNATQSHETLECYAGAARRDAKKPPSM